jgi:hypothetical protein
MMEASRYAQLASQLVDEIDTGDDGQELKGELLRLFDQFVELSAQQSSLVVSLGTLVRLGGMAGIFSAERTQDVLDQMYEQRSYR